MAGIDFAALSGPLSAEDPCGPDLDIEGDGDYLNFFANAEGFLPTSFFDDGVPFDRAAIDFAGLTGGALKLLDRTRDLRLYALAAKLFALNRNIEDFARTVTAMATLLGQCWEQAHPLDEGGNFFLRAAALGTLDESVVLFSLQYAPLVESRRFGAVTYRAQMFALGEAQPREGEASPGASALSQAIAEGAPEKVESVRAALKSLDEALTAIRTIWLERIGSIEALRIAGLQGLVRKIAAFLDPMGSAPAPAGATPGAAAGPAGALPAAIVSGPIANPAAARAALLGIAGYFRRHEPSSPVLPLVLQAEQLMGRSFIEALRALVPNNIGEAAFHIGEARYFDLPVEPLEGLAAAADDGAEGDPPAPAEIATRRDAVQTIDQTIAYFRGAEPSSPIPWLLERARRLVERDFLSILADVMPRSALKDIDDT